MLESRINWELIRNIRNLIPGGSLELALSQKPWEKDFIPTALVLEGTKIISYVSLGYFALRPIAENVASYCI
jgi:hypothetical protein